ncbi:MAG: hypothetical protein F6K30_22860 [Cyanothece sp. SIO2G6]|nr:hypothetical protein [Cyanothece sp. SIO2G6]
MLQLKIIKGLFFRYFALARDATAAIKTSTVVPRFGATVGDRISTLLLFSYWEHFTFAILWLIALSLNPSPRTGEGFQSGPPSPVLGKGAGG